MNPLPSSAGLPAWESRVLNCLHATPVVDLHTHLFDPAFGDLVLWGIDELLVYHYLVAEVFRRIRLPYDGFWMMDKQGQADIIWKHLFLESSPLSEACRGVLTTLNAFGLDPRQSDLASIRRWFAERTVGYHVDACMRLANVRNICMTNSPFDEAERLLWDRGVERDPRFLRALRIDPMLLTWQETSKRLTEWGYGVSAEVNAKTAAEGRRFLEDWTRRIDPWYLMVSLPPDFDYPARNTTNEVIDKIVLPHCRDHGLPFAMMPGVRRAVNPALRLAGDGLGAMNVAALERLCEANSENKFMATVLSRENQHELCVAARKFRNLHIFGCWWFLNVPSLIEEITEMRIELLGTSFTAQHSDARVTDQIIYKWRHSREILARVLARKYLALEQAGWSVSLDELERDCREILGGGFETFCARKG